MTAPNAEIVRLLAEHGWRLPDDETALEIIEAGLERWGFGAALGERYECPHQLVRVS